VAPTGLLVAGTARGGDEWMRTAAIGPETPFVSDYGFEGAGVLRAGCVNLHRLAASRRSYP